MPAGLGDNSQIKEGMDVYGKILEVMMSPQTAGGDANTWQIEFIKKDNYNTPRG